MLKFSCCTKQSLAYFIHLIETILCARGEGENLSVWTRRAPFGQQSTREFRITSQTVGFCDWREGKNGNGFDEVNQGTCLSFLGSTHV